MSLSRTLSSSAASSGRSAASESPESPPSDDLALRLADGTPGEAFARLASAIDAGRLTVHQGKAVADILERRLRILDAEVYRARLEAAESLALEMVRRSAALPAPPKPVTVDAISDSEEAP